jgi:DNA (cytosine-5)-methyltransferase 1
MKILNLYACLGGNRAKWDDVARENNIDIEVTAIEWDEDLAVLYKERFPNDKVIVTDAHEYLRLNFKDYDFIWTSPPCPSHSKIRISQKNRDGFNYIYPDMKLYEEILFLDNFFEGKYVVENVIPFYEPLIKAQKRGRHLYWSNFLIPNDIEERTIGGGGIGGTLNELNKLCDFHEYDFRKYKGKQSVTKIARNLVDYKAGAQIFEAVLGVYKGSNQNQLTIGF